MKKEEQKMLPHEIFEGMTSISALLRAQKDNDRRIEKIWIDREKRRERAKQIGFLTAKSHEYGFPIEFVESSLINEYALGSSHGGILAFCTTRTIPTLTKDHILPNACYVYLEGIEDPYNFGYTVRSLYAAGVAGIILPPRNWMHASGVVARSSAGTSESIPMYVGSADEVIECFRAANYRICSAGIRDSVSVFDADLSYPLLLIIGGEKRGISRAVLDASDEILRIDYGREFAGSLSAASAATVMAFEILRQNRKS